jgi:hemerythrin
MHAHLSYHKVVHRNLAILPAKQIARQGHTGDNMTIQWSDSFNVDNGEINAQHQYLFRLVNDVLNADSKVELTGCIIHLFKYTRKHFAYEEALMRKVKFDEYDAHVLIHDRLVSRLGALGQHIANDTLDKEELKDLIMDWALHHVSKADARLSEFLTTVAATS